MPPKVLPTRADIRTIINELVPRKFKFVQGLEHFRETTKDEKAIAPNPRIGAELGFVYTKDNLTVCAWTTWLLFTDRAREKDSGWVVIEQDGVGIYYVKVHRTKNFAKHLLIEARIAVWRLRTRPTCPVCARPMRIEYGKGRGSRYWRCPFRHSRVSWDHETFLNGLSKEAKQHLRRRRRQRETWYKKCRKFGKPIREAMFRRRAWRRIKLPVTSF
jgi:hypothetical protein